MYIHRKGRDVQCITCDTKKQEGVGERERERERERGGGGGGGP